MKVTIKAINGNPKNINSRLFAFLEFTNKAPKPDIEIKDRAIVPIKSINS